MGKEHGSLRRAATKKIGAFVAVLILALSVPGIALAATTATFSGVTPKAGSSSKVTKPTVSVIVYDKYGVKGNYSMYLDGAKKSVGISRYSGYGYRKFKLTYKAGTLSNALHTARVTVKDLKGHSSSYTWSFRVDTQAPVTAVLPAGFPTYPGVGLIQLSATDNGSGVARTYSVLDNGTTQGNLAFGVFALGNHTIEYWSVDNAGNAEAHHVFSFVIGPKHSLPANLSVSCFAAGCHTGGTSLADIHTAAHGPGCLAACHDGGTGITNCVASGCHSATDSHPLAAPHAGTHPVIASSTTTDTERCTNSTCHGSNVTSIHAAKGCGVCHASTDPAVKAAVTAGLAGTPAACETCHYNATTPDYAALHVKAGTSHTISGACSSSTCHGTDVAKLHSMDFRGTGETPPGCAACHAAGKTPSLDCAAVGCHSASDPHPVTTAHNTATGHAALSSALASATTLPGKLCAGCHGTDVLNILDGQGNPLVLTSGRHAGKAQHEGCSCHAYGEAKLTDPSAGCASCHTGFNDPKSPYGYHVGYHSSTLATNLTASTSNSKGCVSCHGTDVLSVATRDKSTTPNTFMVPALATPGTNQVTEHQGCSCHVYGEVKVGTKQTCIACHGAPDVATAKYPYHVTTATGYHAALITNLDTKAAACTACHGDNVNHVGSRTVAGGTVTVPADPTASVQEHTYCSCHAYHEADPGKTCVDCHSGSYGAIHGWKVAQSSRFPGLWNVSGHNTSMEGTVGARTDFSSLGVTDTAGNAPSEQYPLPDANVFWKSGDTSAPAGAKTGLNWKSVITCEDCHTALTNLEVAGPHGGSAVANWGIDPTYSGSFDTAYLWGTGAAVGNVGSVGTTVTTAGFASGIAQYTPSGTDPKAVASWALYVPDTNTQTSTVLVPGPATVTAGNVICVKCHDLSNPGTGILGYGNMPHEHHADRPIANLGKYQVWGSGVATQAVVAESSTAAKAMVPGATQVKTIIKENLGREGAGACRDCHIAVPHGWTRPRLIVYSTDPAPYNAGPAVYEGEPTTGTVIGSGMMNGIASMDTTTWTAPDLGAGNTAPDMSKATSTHWNGPELLSDDGGLTHYSEWDTSQCNACGHHSGTQFTGTSSQPTWSTRSLNWTWTDWSNGAWK